MNIILIQPQSGTSTLKVPPLGLAYITAILKRHNIDVKIIDLNVESINLREYLKHEKPHVIGISSVVTNARQALEIANLSKKILPESYLVMGGPYPSMMGPRLLTRHIEVDASLIGEAEFTFLKLIQRLYNRKGLGDIEGLIFRENRVNINPLSEPIDPLDQIPFPAREELPLHLYGENAGSIFTSRGCPQLCIFCSRPVFGRKWRGHSADYVLEEIAHLREDYGISNLNILDDNFTFDLVRAEKILDGIIAKRWGLKIYFWNGMRVDHITKNLLFKMKKAGCTVINYGVESVEPDTLSFIRKGISLAQIEKVVNLTHELGIRANVYLMIGNPGDKIKIVDKIMRFVKKMGVDGVHLSMATPFLGTKFWDWIEKNGRWLDYDREELLDWPIDDVQKTYPVFETFDFTAEERIEAYRRTRALLKEKGLLL